MTNLLVKAILALTTILVNDNFACHRIFYIREDTSAYPDSVLPNVDLVITVLAILPDLVNCDVAVTFWTRLNGHDRFW